MVPKGPGFTTNVKEEQEKQEEEDILGFELDTNQKVQFSVNIMAVCTTWRVKEKYLERNGKEAEK